MSHNHNHSCTCSHDDVKYCKGCRTVYCKDCNQEWSSKPNYTWTQTYPWYNIAGGYVNSPNTLYGTVTAGGTTAVPSSGTVSGPSGASYEAKLAQAFTIAPCTHDEDSK